MLVDDSESGTAQHDDVLVKRFDMTHKLDAANQKHRYRHAFIAKGVKKQVLQHFPFVDHGCSR